MVLAFWLGGQLAQPAAQPTQRRDAVERASAQQITTQQATTQQITTLQQARSVEEALIAAVQRAERSVVAIARVRKPRQGQDLGPPQAGEDPRSLVDPTRLSFVPSEYATGVIIDAQGHIATNYHVLGDPEQNDYYVWVQRQPYKAVAVLAAEGVEAGDPWSDLAVLKIDAPDLVPIEYGHPERLRRGSLVVALGNPYAVARDGQPSASWGMVSNLSRSAPPAIRGLDARPARESLGQFASLIQTDIRLPQGTSGGALIDLEGKLVGLTTSLAPLVGYDAEAGYAIPADDFFRRVLQQLKTGRKAAYGFLGIGPEDLSLAQRRRGMRGVRIAQVEPGTAAAGVLQVGDLLTHVNGVAVDDLAEAFRELGRCAASARIQLAVLRGPEEGPRRPRELTVQLTKKHVDAAQPPYARQPDPTWRGLLVDEPTAMPLLLFRQHSHEVDQRGCVGVVEVQPDSPAWKAGLRAGMFVKSAAGKRITRPEQFYQAVQAASGPVELELTASRGAQAIRVVEAAE